MAESLSASVDDAVELGVHGLGVGLVVDRVQHRLDPPPARLRGHAHEVGGVAGATPMPAGPGTVAPIASTRPACASAVTSLTPVRPRAVSARTKASQPAPSSA